MHAPAFVGFYEQWSSSLGLAHRALAKVYPELVVRAADGRVQSVKYEELIPMLLKEVQRQRTALIALEARDEAQRRRDGDLSARLARFEAASATTVARR